MGGPLGAGGVGLGPPAGGGASSTALKETQWMGACILQETQWMGPFCHLPNCANSSADIVRSVIGKRSVSEVRNGQLTSFKIPAVHHFFAAAGFESSCVMQCSRDAHVSRAHAHLGGGRTAGVEQEELEWWVGGRGSPHQSLDGVGGNMVGGGPAGGAGALMGPQRQRRMEQEDQFLFCVNCALCL